jgi:putative FmdB family regulatory protein
MPTYEYRCEACGYEFEEFQSIKDDPISKCPECEEESVQRLIGTGNFILKGRGWYKDLYTKPKSPKPGTNKPE